MLFNDLKRQKKANIKFSPVLQAILSGGASKGFYSQCHCEPFDCAQDRPGEAIPKRLPRRFAPRNDSVSYNRCRPRAFSVLEMLIGLAVLGVVTSVSVVSLEPWVEQYRLKIAAQQVEDFALQAQNMALVQGVSQKIEVRDQQLMLVRDSSDVAEEVIWDSIAEGIEVDHTRWPRFTPFGFATSGSVILSSTHYQIKVIVSSLGSVRQSEIEAL